MTRTPSHTHTHSLTPSLLHTYTHTLPHSLTHPHTHTLTPSLTPTLATRNMRFPAPPPGMCVCDNARLCLSVHVWFCSRLLMCLPEQSLLSFPVLCFLSRPTHPLHTHPCFSRFSFDFRSMPFRESVVSTTSARVTSACACVFVCVSMGSAASLLLTAPAARALQAWMSAHP